MRTCEGEVGPQVGVVSEAQDAEVEVLWYVKREKRGTEHQVMRTLMSFRIF